MEETFSRKSILETKYNNQERPMSQNELNELYKKNMNQLKVSTEMVYHKKSKYFYFVKKYGKKEKELLELKQQNDSDSDYNCDIGNCSITWKLSKTPPHLHSLALEIVNSYMYFFKKDQDKRLTHYKVELAKVFYTWLYKEKYN